jgi:hypothetical protein
MAGLPVSNAIVLVEPSLLASAPSCGFVEFRSVPRLKWHEVPLSKMYPWLSEMVPVQFEPTVLFATMVPVSVTVAALLVRPSELAASVE